MIANNNGSTFLLEWANSERLNLGCPYRLYDFQHLKTTKFMYELFQKVSQKHFCELSHLSFHFGTYFPALEEYLMEVEGKKILRSYRKDILERQSIQEIIKITIFLLLQSQDKSSYITRIVQMNVDVQSYLMEEIKKVQGSMENFVEIKDILSAVERLEQENENLKEKLKHCNQTNQQLTEQMIQYHQENVKIEKEIIKYETEKKHILDQLSINDMKEYIDIYRNIKNENEELNHCIQQIEENKKQIEEENKIMKDKINKDCQTITQLNDEVVLLRTNYNSCKEEMNFLSLSYDPHDSFQDSVLRQNKNVGNVKVRLSLQTSCSDRSFLFNHFYDDQESSQNEKLRNYSNEIMSKLEACHKTIADLTNEVSTLKEDKIKLEKKNLFLQKKMGELKKEQSRFVKELRKMGF